MGLHVAGVRPSDSEALPLLGVAVGYQNSFSCAVEITNPIGSISIPSAF